MATPRSFFLGLSIRARLALIQLSSLTALLVVSLVGWHAAENERRAGHELAVLSRAERNHTEANALLGFLLADVEEALRVDTQSDQSDTLASAKTHVRALQGYLGSLRDRELPSPVAERLGRWTPALTIQANAALTLIEETFRDPRSALQQEPVLRARLDEMSQGNDELTEFLQSAVAAAERRTFTDASRSEVGIATVFGLTALLAFSFVALISKSVRRSLSEISDAARALAAGNLSARSSVHTPDEVGELALSLNKMADDLQRMVDRMLAEAHRDAFGTQVTRALEMAESEGDVFGITARALPQVGERMPAELLLSVSGQESLQQVSVHVSAGSPGCPVETLSGCTAIRRGGPVTFETSEALDACPRLRARPAGPLSATCVPVTFMGKTFGVLHAVAADRKPPTSYQQAQLATLGGQIATRIGSLRALESTRVHAYTDPLTALGNRRAMEQTSGEVMRAGRPYALAMADLDHFKRLNDLDGHEAGDQALTLFADVIRKSIRQADRAARWGGEEFAILFPDVTAEQALEVIERIRSRLDEALTESKRRRFTASFGVADSGMGDSFVEVLRVADEALYASKAAGRNRATRAPSSQAQSETPSAASSELKILERG